MGKRNPDMVLMSRLCKERNALRSELDKCNRDIADLEYKLCGFKERPDHQELKEDLRTILENIVDVNPEFSKVVDDNFWKLF